MQTTPTCTAPSAHSRRRTATARCIAACAVFALGWFALAHDDPDHEGDYEDPYGGPGYKSEEGGEPPLPFQSNGLVLQSWITVLDFGPEMQAANDCWGYVSPSGREYAIIGLSHGTGFVEVTNPGSAEIVEFFEGPTSTWRDIKTYQHYAYAVSEGGWGIQVFDLSGIDDGDIDYLGNVTGPGTDKTHNVAINEESGYLYRCGGGSNGLRIYSLADPANPTFVGAWSDRYAHDAQIVTWTDGPYAGREIAFAFANNSSGGGNPAVDILDVTDKSNITSIAQAAYQFPAYCHQGWLSPDRTHIYVGDELNEVEYGLTTTTNIIDITDLDNPVDVGIYTNGNDAITHNIYTRDNLLFQANYRSGLRIADISDPATPTEIAFFDTYTSNDNPNFNGLWSNYPYLPSGTIIGSDREKGLFVWTLELEEPIPGDLNGDGTVDGADLAILLGAWGACSDCEPPANCPADLDDSCAVDGADLAILLGNWG